MKKHLLKIVAILFCMQQALAQESKAQENYVSSLDALSKKEYALASKKFSKVIDELGLEISKNALYNGACIYALNGEKEKAFQLLNRMVKNQFYDDYNHIKKDSDLKSLYNDKRWGLILQGVKKNLETLPERQRETMIKELSDAKKRLDEDGGKLWGENFWSDKILILDFDYNIYSLDNLPKSKTKDSILYFKSFKSGEIGYTNSSQEYNNDTYATVLINYLDDKSETIIHELFHVLHTKKIKLNGYPIPYLDNYDARVLLRLEYNALKEALKLVKESKSRSEVTLFLKDALLFRKERQEKYSEYIKEELEIENLEGLAQYTGIKLSGSTSKYDEIIENINSWEGSKTYTRNFPYATGPAYGFLFDFLEINWRKELDKIYNFLSIFQEDYLKTNLSITKKELIESKKRNNYKEILKEEKERKKKTEALIKFYKDLFYNNPVVKVKYGEGFGISYDMNGSMTFNKKDIIYSSVSGGSKEEKYFGTFSTIQEKAKLGLGGVLGLELEKTLVFSAPTKIEGNKITGDNYTIVLNEGWELKKLNNGNFEIIKK